MPIINKTKRTAAIYNHGREVVKVYDHGTLAWQKQSSIPDYLCFTALDDNTQFTFTKFINLASTVIPSISYSLDNGSTWTDVQMSGQGNEDIVTTPAVNAGGKVLWKAEAARFANSATGYSTFTANGRFNASGNILSLLYGDDYGGKTDTRTDRYTFSSLFRGCTTLIDASQLKLPTGHLNVGDFLGLFRDCTNLVHGAPLYAPNIPQSCCYWMYYGCTSMTEMPAIAATSMINDNGDLAKYCLWYAFYGCSNMEGDVKLNIVGDVGREVLDGCFTNCSKITSADLAFNGALDRAALRGAFVGCSSLSHVKCLATSFYDDGTAANGSLYNWMNNVSSTGVFVQADGIQWPRGKSGIPTRWVDIEKRTMPSGYKQLLQVTSNGTAYIQLSFGFEETDEVAATFSVDNTQGNDKYIVSSQTWNSNNNRYGLGQHMANHYYTPAFGGLGTGSTCLTPLTANNGELHNWTYASRLFTLVDLSLSKDVSSITFGGVTTNLRLFYGMAPNNTKGAISSYKHIKGSITVCDFVAAVRESDDTAGLYDLANDEFMTCNGLTAGEEI